MRNLGEHAATVAGLLVGTDGTAMVEVEQDLQAHADDVVRLRVVHVGDEADAAGIVLVGGIIQALRLRHEWIAHRAVAAHGGIERRLRLRSGADAAHLARAETVVVPIE